MCAPEVYKFSRKFYNVRELKLPLEILFCPNENDDCSAASDYKQIKKYAIKHFLKTHVTRDTQLHFPVARAIMFQLPLRTWKIMGNGMDRTRIQIWPVNIIRAANPFVWKDNRFRRWEQSSSLAHWLNQQKKNDEKRLENLLEEASSSLQVPNT